MRKLLVVVVLVAVFVGGYLYRLPYQAVNRLRDGLRTGSKADLEDTIDFDAVRRSLKDELAAGLVDAVRDKTKGAGAGEMIGAALGAAFAEKVGGALLDACLTPAGLARLASGDSPNTIGDESGKGPGDLFEGAGYEYRSLSTFVVRVSEKTGGQTEFVMRRDGITWKLGAIQFRRGK